MGEPPTGHTQHGIIIRKTKKASLAARGLTGVAEWRSGGVPVERQRRMRSCPEKSNHQPAAAPCFIFPTRSFDTGKVIPHSPPLRLGVMRVGGIVGDKSEDDGRDKRRIKSIYCCCCCLRIRPIDQLDATNPQKSMRACVYSF